MARYVLGESAARKFRELVAGRMRYGHRDGGGAASVFDADYAHPYAVQWAASLAKGETSEGAGDGTSGEWIIWLPSDDLLTVGKSKVKVSEGLAAAGGDYPAGWYKLGAALDRDAGGALYLNIVNGETVTAAFSAEAGTASETTIPVLICEALVDEETGGRSVKASVMSAIVIGAGGDDGETKHIPDELSLSNQREGDGASQPTAYWSIMGFGKFTDSGGSEHGKFTPSSTFELEEGQETEFAFVCRNGNTASPNLNSVGYKTLKLKVTPTPFQYTAEKVEGSEELVRTISNNVFYFDGVEQSLSPYNPPLDGFVYLTATRGPADEETGETPEWTFAMSTEPAEAPEGGKAQNIKLYEFAAGKVKCDYRTTFLTLASGDGSEAKTINLDGLVTLGTEQTITGQKTFRSTGRTLRIPLIAGFTGFEYEGVVEIDARNETMAICYTGYNDDEWTQLTLNSSKDGVVSCAAVSPLSAIESVMDSETCEVILQVGNAVKYFLQKKNLPSWITAGDGIEISPDTDTGKITISATGGGGGGGGSIVIGSSHTATSLGPTASPSVNVAGNGTSENPLTFAFGIPKGANGEPGTSVTITSISPGTDATAVNFSDGTSISIPHGKDGVVDASRLKPLQVNGEGLGMLVDGTGGNIVQRSLAEGDGITLTEAGNTIVISATGTTKGYSGPRTVLADVDFSSPNLRKRFYTETWEDGVLVDFVLGEWQTYHTAVEETV